LKGGSFTKSLAGGTKSKKKKRKGTGFVFKNKSKGKKKLPVGFGNWGESSQEQTKPKKSAVGF
jgi:hypothetical protein